MMTKQIIVEIFSKPNCHLCDDLKQIIKKVHQDTEFIIKEIDITKDELLFEKYKYEIPVVHINGLIAFKYRVDENEFRKKLKARS
ncbi:MAG: glutaredoxin family protein [Candidatus Sericytochromatia bacterium]|nr:glutaredoxin family protein [Candidatus Sericytochromatia bacterium]